MAGICGGYADSIIIRFFTSNNNIGPRSICSRIYFFTCSNLRSFFHVAHGIVLIGSSVSIPLLILGYIVFNGKQYTYRNGTGTGNCPFCFTCQLNDYPNLCISVRCEGQCLNLLFSFSATFFWLSNPHCSIIFHHLPSFAIIFHHFPSSFVVVGEKRWLRAGSGLCDCNKGGSSQA
jgi:hypothetical protein